MDSENKERMWREVFSEIAEEILANELISKYPEIKQEEERRPELYE